MSPKQSQVPERSNAAALGQQLRFSRIAAQFATQAALADKLCVHPTIVTKAETGGQLPTEQVYKTWMAECAVAGQLRSAIDALWILARNKEHPGQARAVPYYETEASAHTLRYWAPLLVPGLVQTADYARAIYEAWRHSPEGIEERVASRMARQSVLTADGPDVTIIVWEPVLNNLIGSPQVMRGQIARLVELFKHRKVNIHVLPSSAGANMGLGGAINLATTDADEVLMIDGFSEDFVTSEPTRVRAAAVTFNGVRADALNRAASLAVLTEAMERWSTKASAGESPATAETTAPLTV